MPNTDPYAFERTIDIPLELDKHKTIDMMASCAKALSWDMQSTELNTTGYITELIHVNIWPLLEVKASPRTCTN